MLLAKVYWYILHFIVDIYQYSFNICVGQANLK